VQSTWITEYPALRLLLPLISMNSST
jgi:hypothetical protein